MTHEHQEVPTSQLRFVERASGKAFGDVIITVKILQQLWEIWDDGPQMCASRYAWRDVPIVDEP